MADRTDIQDAFDRFFYLATISENMDPELFTADKSIFDPDWDDELDVDMYDDDPGCDGELDPE